MLRLFPVFALLILGALSFASPSMAATSQQASSFANDLGHQALAVITGAGSKDEKRGKLEALFEQYVDIDWIGRFVLGRYWRDATPEQQQKYLTNYKTFLIKHYTSNLTEFTDANFEVIKVTPDSRDGQVVTMKLKRPRAEDTIVSYTVRSKDAGLKVYDLTVEGVSMITTQRSEFSSVVGQKGLDYLIDQLAKRSAASSQQN